MHPQFTSIDKEKQDRIINAAFEIFSKNSFQKASTNEIVEKAGISKGILFHYFKSKQALYDYLKHFAFSTMVDAIDQELDWEATDFFNRLKQVGLIKTKILMQYPFMTSFIQVLHQSLSIEEMMALVALHNPTLMVDVYQRNIDYSKFKPGVDLQRVINMTQWTFEKLGETWFSRHDPAEPWDFEGLAQDSDAYIELLKQAFYKQEVLS